MNILIENKSCIQDCAVRSDETLMNYMKIQVENLFENDTTRT
jgi:hypothetical protein